VSLEAWLLFAATETILCLTPGPAVLLVLSTSLTRGWSAGLQASLGILIANLFYFALCATSIGAVLLASGELFFAIKWIGAAYLVWIGLRTLFSDTTPIAADVAPPSRRDGVRTILHGVVAQGANPKALVFFISFLPQFVDPAAPIVPQIAILAVTSLVIELAVLAGYAVLAGRVSAAARRPRFARLVTRVGGVLLIAAGAGLATLRR